MKIEAGLNNSMISSDSSQASVASATPKTKQKTKNNHTNSSSHKNNINSGGGGGHKGGGVLRSERSTTDISEMSQYNKSETTANNDDWNDSQDYAQKRKMRAEKEKLLLERAEVT